MFKFIYFYRTLLVLVILASILAIITNGTLLLQGPMSNSEPNAADWLSAISTFWGAVATALGAVLTCGALLVAALTYSRQVADKHQEIEDKRKEQAAKIIVRVERGLPDGKTLVDLKNPTNLPIFKMNLYTIDSDGQVIDRQPLSQEVVVGDYPGHHFNQRDRVHSAYAKFTDSGGVAWIRTSRGTLVEKGKEPNGFDPREMWQPGDPMHTWETWY